MQIIGSQGTVIAFQIPRQGSNIRPFELEDKIRALDQALVQGIVNGLLLVRSEQAHAGRGLVQDTCSGSVFRRHNVGGILKRRHQIVCQSLGWSANKGTEGSVGSCRTPTDNFFRRCCLFVVVCDDKFKNVQATTSGTTV